MVISSRLIRMLKREQSSKKEPEESKYNQYGAGISKGMPTRGPEVKKEKDNEEEYEEDFELSESYVPEDTITIWK
jgi:hypothetical protein